MLPNPRKTTSVRPLGQIDIEDLRQAVMAIPEHVWEAENSQKPNRFDALDRTRHIVFRFVNDTRDWRQSYDLPAWEQWRVKLMPIMMMAVRAYGYEHGMFPRVMLARMGAGGVIHPHRDANPAAKWPHKIHVPVTTNEDVRFFVDGIAYHFKEGQAVEVNNMAVHGVENAGKTDRIHLIFEYYDMDQPDPDWVNS